MYLISLSLLENQDPRAVRCTRLTKIPELRECVDVRIIFAQFALRGANEPVPPRDEVAKHAGNGGRNLRRFKTAMGTRFRSSIAPSARRTRAERPMELCAIKVECVWIYDDSVSELWNGINLAKYAITHSCDVDRQYWSRRLRGRFETGTVHREVSSLKPPEILTVCF